MKEHSSGRQDLSPALGKTKKMAQGMSEALSRRLKTWVRLLVPKKKAQGLSQDFNKTEEGLRPEW